MIYNHTIIYHQFFAGECQVGLPIGKALVIYNSGEVLKPVPIETSTFQVRSVFLSAGKMGREVWTIETAPNDYLYYMLY